MFKKFTSIALVLVLAFSVFALAGCGSEPAVDDGADTGAAAGTPGWDYIAEKGELIVGLDDTFAPMGFRDEAGELVGFDIDLATAVCEELGVAVKFQPIDWDAKELELSSKNIDCIWNGMSATPERQESMALTNKYFNNCIIIMALSEDVAVSSVEDLANYNVATQADSAALEVMMDTEGWDTYSANVQEYLTYDECILALKGGRADVIAVDQVLGEYKNSQMDGELFTLDFNFGDDFYAIGCRAEDTDVAAKITEGIQTVIDNGKAAEISDKWFGKDLVICEDYE